MRRNSILYVAAIVIVLGCSNSKQPKRDRLSKASRENKNGWIYVHLEGTPPDIGYQHGYLLANDIDTSIQSVAHLLQHDSHRDWQFYRSATAELAKNMQLWAQMGHPCGGNFIGATFFKMLPEYAWQSKYLNNMMSYPWTLFSAKR